MKGTGGFSSLFTSGKSLFETSNLTPLTIPSNDKKEETKDEEDEVLKLDEKEQL